MGTCCAKPSPVLKNEIKSSRHNSKTRDIEEINREEIGKS